MSTEAAQTVLYAIAAIEFVVWIIAFEFLRGATVRRRERRIEAMDRFGLPEPPAGEIASGEIEVKGDPRSLATKFASALAKEGTGMFGPAKLLEVTDDSVAFETIGMLGQRSGRSTIRGRVDFRQGRSGQTEAAYLIEAPDAGRLLKAGWAVQWVGFAALVAVLVLMRLYLVDHPSQAARVQVVQMIQVAHLLWPPFLLATIARRQTGGMASRLDAMLNNLPYA